MTNKTITLSTAIQIADAEQANKFELTDKYNAILRELKEECYFKGVTGTAKAPDTFLAEISKKTFLRYLESLIEDFNERQPIKASGGFSFRVEDVLISLDYLDILQGEMTLSFTIVTSKLDLVDTLGSVLIIKHPNGSNRVLNCELSSSLLLNSVE